MLVMSSNVSILLPFDVPRMCRCRAAHRDTTALFACFVLRVFNPEARLANPVPTARLLTYFGLAFWGLVTFSWQPPMPIGGGVTFIVFRRLEQLQS